MAYYSFVTLTPLGYGDILPVSQLARFFACMEAIAGLFYMAIVVATLVSIGIRENTAGKLKDGNKDAS
ncbi:potassium channel family protein [Thiolapillus brandeum]|uniref:potassium channel family protein n=1 Tax=Thiolapillus brandeum TaxID=1076588 RepID=UPI000695A614|nr:potassium channel family protein [Thiolapillus brandeum]